MESIVLSEVSNKERDRYRKFFHMCIYKSIVAKAAELMNVSTEPSLLWWGGRVWVGHLGRGEESTLKQWWRKRDNLGKIA